MSFVNLHAHSHYSLLDGYGSPEAIILRAKELGYPAAALTDHGVTYGLIELFKAGKQHNIKPILGCEFYVAPRSRHDKEAKIDVKPYHLSVIAKNNEGYKNILKLTTKAHLEGFYYKPRIDYDLLEKHSEGLIVLSGCIAAHLPRLILSGNEEETDKLIRKFIDIFGQENYFLEIQHHPMLENQQIVNEKIKELAPKYGLGIVATFDSHYPRIEDKEAHDILLCIQTGTTVDDQQRMRYDGDFSIKNIEEMREIFKEYPNAIENTVKIAEMCEVDLDFSQNLIPSYDTPKDKSPKDYLKELCEKGLEKRCEEMNSETDSSSKTTEIPKEYQERLDYELSIVNKMGFDTYFLIVQDFVNFAKDRNITVGPGRGSAAGSIIAWSLRITELDPIKYGLFFERFLNPERISMPDIDIDFADNRRDEVLEYVIEKYGESNVAQIITFGTMAPKAAIKDVGRALGYPYAEVDQISKTVPPAILGKYAPLKESLENDKELSKLYQENPRAKVLLDYAKELEGTVRHVGTHACAVIISEKPLTEYTALQNAAGKGEEIVTQYDAPPLESLGLLKMDFLGLRNLTVLDKTLEILKETKKIEIDLEKISLEDEKTFKLLQRAETTGVFQLESGGMRRYLKELKPTEFDDIVAMGALYRPGPMEWIPQYIKGKHNPKKVKYLHESFKEILEKTHGVAVYQEQILQLARDFAGFTLGEADILRKAVGKKDPKLLAEQREKFIKGATENDHKKEFAKEVFEKVVEPFAGYGFNKAHAVCYGLIAYHTAYLKANYPLEFMTALLCADASNTDRVVLEIKECLEMGIDILPPSLNESFTNFAITGENKVRFGLMAVKGLGEGPVSEIIAEREKNGKFISLEDFAKRVPLKNLNKKSIQALAYCGALDEFGDRNQIAENYTEIVKFAKEEQDQSNSNQGDLFGMLDEEETSEFDKIKFIDVPKSTMMQRLKWEKEILGMYVSGHPLRGLNQYIALKSKAIGSMTKKSLNKKVRIIGTIVSVKKIVTRNGAYMATFQIEDTTGRLNCVIFPKNYNDFAGEIIEDKVIGLTGKLDNKRGPYQFIVDAIKPLSLETMIENAKQGGIYNPEDKSDIAIRDLDTILAEKDEDLIDEEDLDSSENPEGKFFQIKIPASTTKEKMQELKELLINNRGETSVLLTLEANNKKVKLPFGINLDTGLEEKIKALI